MKLSFFTMPIHPLGKPVAQCLREDREAFLLADRLGYAEAYCGEHSTDLAENIWHCIGPAIKQELIPLWELPVEQDQQAIGVTSQNLGEDRIEWTARTRTTVTSDMAAETEAFADVVIEAMSGAHLVGRPN